jgi:prevent-host-death family protein
MSMRGAYTAETLLGTEEIDLIDTYPVPCKTQPVSVNIETTRRLAMTAVSIKEAQAKLSELIQKLKPGDEVIIMEKNVPVARLLSVSKPLEQRKLGTLRGTVKYMADDFDAPLDEFKEYMQ